MSQGNNEASWERMCAIADCLGLLTPETVPYLENWAAKIRARMEALDRILTLVCDIHEAQLRGQCGLEAMRIHVMDMANKVVNLPLDTVYLSDTMYRFAEIEKDVHRATNFEGDEVGRVAALLRGLGEEDFAAKLLKLRPQLER